MTFGEFVNILHKGDEQTMHHGIIKNSIFLTQTYIQFLSLPTAVYNQINAYPSMQ